jgi:hypothetical protein
MATVYNPPAELPWEEPDYKNYDYRKEQAREDAYAKKLAEWCKSRNKGDCVGEIVRWGVADGYAQYMVECEKPLRLIHLPFGDGYSAGKIWERGLRLNDVRQMVHNNRNPLFGSSRVT